MEVFAEYLARIKNSQHCAPFRDIFHRLRHMKTTERSPVHHPEKSIDRKMRVVARCPIIGGNVYA